MGEVYQAKDWKLQRDVAIKVLPPSLSSDADALARFEREALAVAALSHPNILSIFDFGSQDGITYAVTELLEGETLRSRLGGGPIAQKQAVDYALQVARGLTAAHEKGIVHRDLKPENLFVSTNGHVKILDFGLAKKIGTASPAEETSAPTVSGHTEPGVLMGTMGYMSPEQVRGLPIDHRSDLFSFGAILYELLSGKRAFRRQTVADTMAAIMNEEPPELAESGRNISPALDHIVKHCLEKDRKSRFQTARDVAFNLSELSSPTVTSGALLAVAPARRDKVLVALAAVVVLTIGGMFLVRRMHRAGGESGDVKRVAVLPFENLGAPEDDYFADGIADEVRAKLTSLPGFQVIARGSSTPYRKTTKTPKQIAEELSTPYLLTATVRWEKSGGTNRVHVTPELVDVTNPDAPTSRWQQPFDAAITDVFQVQSEIATKVAQALGGTLGEGGENRLSAKPTQSLAAYDAFLKGEESRQTFFDQAGKRKALGYYEQAVALDPGFARAWARVAETSLFLYATEGPAPSLAERGRDAAQKAIALAPDRAEGYLAMGRYEDWVVGDHDRAMEQFSKGSRVEPGNVDILVEVAVQESNLDRPEHLDRLDAAIQHLRQAERLDPLSAEPPAALGQTFLQLRRYSEAREALDRAIVLSPTELGLIEWRAMLPLAQGDLAGARAVLRSVPKTIEPTALVAQMAGVFDLIWVLDDDQRDLLLRLTPSAFGDDEGVWSLCMAQAYALKGDADKARTYAEEARKTIAKQLDAANATAPKGWIAQYEVNLGLALAYLGRKEEAIEKGKRGVEAFPSSYYRHQLLRIYMILGESEKALDELEALLKVPYWLSPGWLEIDPNFDVLRKNPRFQKLVART
jgi:eukaryotic-like serine/threonine-protein kinase